MPTSLPRRTLLAGASTALFLGRSARAESWPNRPIRLVVPFPAGGTVDTMARLLAEQLSRELGQQVIVDNRAGASGTIGSGSVAHAPADGYTLLFGSIADQVIAPLIIQPLPYDAVRGFTPVSLLIRAPSLLVTHPELPAKTIDELVALAKAAPGKLTFGSSGLGNTSHLLVELLKREAGIDVTIVPYKGNGPALNDLLAGHVQAMFSSPLTTLEAIGAHRLLALAATTDKRLPALPEVPTFAEAGLPGLTVYSWSCLLAPAGTPAAIIDRLNAAVDTALSQPDLQKRMLDQDATVVGGAPERLANYLASERARWGKVVESAGIKAVN